MLTHQLHLQQPVHLKQQAQLLHSSCLLELHLQLPVSMRVLHLPVMLEPSGLLHVLHLHALQLMPLLL
jgi:hypothetical protein